MTSNHIDVYFVQVGPTSANSDITHMAEARLISAYNLSQSGQGQESIEHSICNGEYRLLRLLLLAVAKR